MRGTKSMGAVVARRRAGCWAPCAQPSATTAADTPELLLEGYAEQAKAADPAFDGFSAERGRSFYLSKHVMKGVGAVSCASCHRKDPREQVKAHKVDILCRACHVINDEEHPKPKEAKLRYIEPFAPHANPERFSDSAHVEKFFKLNCTMVLKRECTPAREGRPHRLAADGGGRGAVPGGPRHRAGARPKSSPMGWGQAYTLYFASMHALNLHLDFEV